MLFQNKTDVLRGTVLWILGINMARLLLFYLVLTAFAASCSRQIENPESFDGLYRDYLPRQSLSRGAKTSREGLDSGQKGRGQSNSSDWDEGCESGAHRQIQADYLEVQTTRGFLFDASALAKRIRSKKIYRGFLTAW